MIKQLWILHLYQQKNILLASSEVMIFSIVQYLQALWEKDTDVSYGFIGADLQSRATCERE